MSTISKPDELEGVPITQEEYLRVKDAVFVQIDKHKHKFPPLMKNMYNTLFWGLENPEFKTTLRGRILHARRWFKMDKDKVEGKDPQTVAYKELLKEMTAPDPNSNSWFITLRYDQTAFQLSYYQRVVDRFKNAMYHGDLLFMNVYWTHECHTANGVFHHSHFLVNSDAPRSKIMEILKKSFMGRRFRIISQAQFIDIKNNDQLPREAAIEYLRGNKKIEKMVGVERDRDWRLANDIIINIP